MRRKMMTMILKVEDDVNSVSDKSNEGEDNENKRCSSVNGEGKCDGGLLNEVLCKEVKVCELSDKMMMEMR
jgi:hypothetical protein